MTRFQENLDRLTQDQKRETLELIRELFRDLTEWCAVSDPELKGISACAQGSIQCQQMIKELTPQEFNIPQEEKEIEFTLDGQKTSS